MGNLHPAVTGAIAGLVLAIVIYALDYMMINRGAADRAARTKRKAELDSTERKSLISLFRFLIFMPLFGALLFWMLS